MKICSVTITPTSEAAVASRATVDDLVDQPFALVHEEPITDFSTARNEALEFAAERDYDWALMLDTDERIIIQREHWLNPEGDPGEAMRAMLALMPDVDVLMIPHVSGTYEKEHLFRLPARGHYHGPTHEAWLTDDGAKRETVRWLAFDELAKTPEQYRAKVERDRAILETWTREHPDDPRWFYYLADSYSGLGMIEEAISEFSRCWLLDGWDEESAWACYRAAELSIQLDRYESAIEWCTRGMRRYPGMAELPWLAGYCAYQVGNHRKAIWWAEMAKALNNAGAHRERIGFRHPPALSEGPLDVMRHAYHALGDRDGVLYAEERFQSLLELRLRRQTHREQDRSPALE